MLTFRLRGRHLRAHQREIKLIQTQGYCLKDFVLVFVMLRIFYNMQLRGPKSLGIHLATSRTFIKVTSSKKRQSGCGHIWLKGPFRPTSSPLCPSRFVCSRKGSQGPPASRMRGKTLVCWSANLGMFSYKGGPLETACVIMILNGFRWSKGLNEVS